MTLLKRFCAAALCVAMLACAAACHKQNEAVLTIDGYDIPSGLYLALQFDAFGTFVSGVKAENPSSTVSVAQYTDYLNQSLESKDSTTWIDDKILELAKSYVAVERGFENAGLSLSESNQSTIDSYVTYYWENYGYQEIYEKNGVSKASFRLTIENNFKKNLLFNYYYDKADDTGKGGIYTVSDEDIFSQLGQSYILADSITFAATTTDSTTKTTTSLTEDEIAAKVAVYDGYAARINSGKADFAAIRTESGDTSSSSSTSTATTSIYPSTAKAYSSTDSDTTLYELFSEQKKADGFSFGKAYVVKDTVNGNYYLAEFYDISKDPYYQAQYRTAVLHLLKDDEFENLLSTTSADYTVSENSGNINYYSPKNIDLSSSSK